MHYAATRNITHGHIGAMGSHALARVRTSGSCFLPTRARTEQRRQSRPTKQSFEFDHELLHPGTRAIPLHSKVKVGADVDSADNCWSLVRVNSRQNGCGFAFLYRPQKGSGDRTPFGTCSQHNDIGTSSSTNGRRAPSRYRWTCSSPPQIELVAP